MSQILLYIATFTLLFYATALVIKKERHISDVYLAAWLVVLAASLVVIDFRLDNIDISFSFLHCVFLFFYVRSLTKVTVVKTKYLRHFIPFLVVLTVGIFYSDIFDRYQPLIMAILLVHNFIYFYFTIKLSKAYKAYIYKNYSTENVADTTWLMMITSGTIFLYFVNYTSFALHQVYATPMKPTIYILLLLIGLIIAGLKAVRLGIIFIKKNVLTIPEDNNIEHLKSETYSNYGLKESESHLLAEKLKSYMEQKKPYTNPDLCLKDLASAMDAYPHYITQVLNTIYNQNFYEFVNNYRIEEAKIQLTNPLKSNYTIVAVANDCGFNSKSSFNRFFKQNTGVTPTEYKQSYIGSGINIAH